MATRSRTASAPQPSRITRVFLDSRSARSAITVGDITAGLLTGGKGMPRAARTCGVRSLPPLTFSATVTRVQIGPQGMPHQPASKEISEYERPFEKALSPGRKKMIGDDRLNDSTMTETQNWKRTNFAPAATAC